MCKSAVFPHQRMAENQPKRTLVFHGERMMWISPVTLDELQDLKAAHPKAPLVVGNTGVGMYSQNVFCCIFSTILELWLWNVFSCLKCISVW